MEEFYKFNKNYIQSVIKCTTTIKNIKLVDLYEDYYGKRRMPEMKYFNEPKISDYPLNLNSAKSSYRLRDTIVVYGTPLSKILNWAIVKGEDIEGEAIKVYTHRQTLLRIMLSVYLNSNERGDPRLAFNIYATKYKNNLYLMSENDEALQNENMFSAFHHNFENILFSDFDNTGSKTNKPMDENIRLAGLYHGHLDKYHLFYSCELQGIQSDTKIGDISDMNVANTCRFINTKVIPHSKPKIHWMLNRYLQNFLSNIDVTYVAVRDANGFVSEPVSQLHTANMPEGQYWKPQICQQFLYDFLEMIMEKMFNINCLETTYVFKNVPKEHTIFVEIHEGRTDKTFLSDEYIKYIQTITKLNEKCG